MAQASTAQRLSALENGIAAILAALAPAAPNAPMPANVTPMRPAAPAPQAQAQATGKTPDPFAADKKALYALRGARRATAPNTLERVNATVAYRDALLAAIAAGWYTATDDTRVNLAKWAGYTPGVLPVRVNGRASRKSRPVADPTGETATKRVMTQERLDALARGRATAAANRAARLGVAAPANVAASTADALAQAKADVAAFVASDPELDELAGF